MSFMKPTRSQIDAFQKKNQDVFNNAVGYASQAKEVVVKPVKEYIRYTKNKLKNRKQFLKDQDKEMQNKVDTGYFNS